MSKVVMVATFTCAEGKTSEMDAVLADQVAAASQLDGVEVYSYHRGEDHNYSFFAVFTSAESISAHAQAEPLMKQMQKFMALLDGPPQMSTYTPVAASGLDL